MEAYTLALFKWAEKNKHKIKLWMYFYYIATINPRFKKFNTEIRKIGRQRIVDLIKQGVEKKVLPELSLTQIHHHSFTIQGLITGNIFMCLSEQGLNIKKTGNMTFESIWGMLNNPSAQ